MFEKGGVITSHKITTVITYPHPNLSSLQWRHNEREGISNHPCPDCLLIRLFRRRSRKHQRSASLAFVRGIHRWPVDTRCCGHQIGLIYFIQYFQLVFLWNAFGRPTRVFHGRFTWYLNGILEFCFCMVMTWFAVLCLFKVTSIWFEFDF